MIHPFLETKLQYNTLREEEKNRIIDSLNQNGYQNKNGGPISHNSGKGIAEYTSGGKFNDKPYNLSNWKYVEAQKEILVLDENGRQNSLSVNYFISLQAFDIDPSSYNVHVLFDRIGIYVYTGKYIAKQAFFNMKTTKFELPLDEVDLEELIKELDNLCGEYFLNRAKT